MRRDGGLPDRVWLSPVGSGASPLPAGRLQADAADGVAGVPHGDGLIGVAGAPRTAIVTEDQELVMNHQSTAFPRLRLTVALAAGLALALTACSDGEDTELDTAALEPAEEEEDADLEQAGTQPDEPDEPAEESDDDGAADIEVELVDFAFVGLPDSVPAGTRLSVVNTAEAELHELVAFRLPDDEERAVSELIQLPPEEVGPVIGEPTAVLLAAPGGPQISAVGDGTFDEPGRYAILCFIPTGVAPEVYLEAAAATESGPPQVEGGPPHFTQGMYAELIVE